MFFLSLGRSEMRDERIGSINSSIELGNFSIKVDVDEVASLKKRLNAILLFLSNIRQQGQNLVIFADQNIGRCSFRRLMEQ